MLKAFLRNLVITVVIVAVVFLLSGHLAMAGFVGLMTFAAIYGF